MLKKFLFLMAVTLTLFSAASANSAKSAILIDASSGRVLFEKNANEKLGMASTTKIMTAVIALENSDLSEIVTVSQNAAATEGSSMYLNSGEKIKMESLLYGLMLNSGNDAATAIAEHIGGDISGFAELMNKKAHELNLKATHFKNPHGLDDKEHYSTAHDMAILARYAMKNEKFREIVFAKTKAVEQDGKESKRFLKNHNRLLSMYEYCTGIKTGYTKSCGRCLVTSAQKNGTELIAVTLCDPNDWNDHISMYNEAFSKYKKYVIIPKNSYVTSVKPTNSDTLAALKAESEVSAVLTEKEFGNISIFYETEKNIKAPLFLGQNLGVAKVSTGTEVLGTSALTAREGIETEYKPNFCDSLFYILTNLLALFKTAI